MRPEHVVIINNKISKVQLVQRLLYTAGYDPANIWPPQDIRGVSAPVHAPTFTDWGDVFETLPALGPLGFTPQKGECFLLLDLALDEANQAYTEGAGQIERHVTHLTDYITVAFTVWASSARRQLLGRCVDGVIDTTATELPDVRRAARILDSGLQRAVEAWIQRTGNKQSAPRQRFLVAESPGGRAALAALSQAGIDFLVQQEASNWTDVRVHAFTGGFSGSHLLKIEGRFDGTPQSIVCKVARERPQLEREMERVTSAMKSYETFAGNFVPYPETTPKEIGDDEAWYLVQSKAPGDTVEDVISSSSTPDARAVQTLVNQTRKITDLMKPPVRPQTMIPNLKMRDEDIDRFATTCQRLVKVAKLCASRHLIADPLLTEDQILKFAVAVGKWNTVMPPKFDPVQHIAQHGDYNARNIFVAADDKLQLIDFARYGQWPVGYDLTRLELQILIRGIDTFSGEEQFPDSLPEWQILWLAIEPAAPAERSVEFADRYGAFVTAIDQLAGIRAAVFARLVPESSAEQRHALISLMRAFDAIKMCSYQDTTAFKQLWFLQISMHAARAAGMEF